MNEHFDSGRANGNGNSCDKQKREIAGCHLDLVSHPVLPSVRVIPR